MLSLVAGTLWKIANEVSEEDMDGHLLLGGCVTGDEFLIF